MRDVNSLLSKTDVSVEDRGGPFSEVVGGVVGEDTG